MGDFCQLLMYKIRIQSKIKDYEVLFSSNFIKNIKNINNPYYIIDKKIFKLYKFSNIIKKNYLLINANEKSKEYNHISTIINQLIKNKISKSNNLIAIGGGVTQDIVSFISMILFRGLNWYYFPTTLLSMGDSCIGSKLSVNYINFKNQLGGYYPPTKIFINKDFLNTLPKKEIYSGLGEIAHYYFLSNSKNLNFFQKSMSTKKDIKLINFDTLILKTLEIKKKFIEIDEFDNNKRLLLNYGHTFGHAIETYTNYKISHGIAVTIGMNIANYFSFKQNYLSKKNFIKFKKILQLINNDMNIKNLDLKVFKEILMKDKKVINNYSRFILSKGIGKMFVKKMKLDSKFIKILKEYNNEH